MKNKISVIMAVFNCEKTICKAIDSILAQTYTNWVFVICNDGSTDGTWAIVQDYAARYPEKFILLENDRNRKLPYSLNHCLQHVETDLVARMDGDDWSTPDRFEKQVTFLKNHPEYDLVSTGVTVFDGEKSIASIIKIPEPNRETIVHQNAFSHATIMTYKRVYDALEGYSLDPTVERVEDVDLWYRFMAAGFRGYNLPDELYVILEDMGAAKRRTIRARFNGAKTASRGRRKLGYRGWICWKPYIGVLKALVPNAVYQRIHLFRLQKGQQ